jgi:hypothetical protein
VTRNLDIVMMLLGVFALWLVVEYGRWRRDDRERRQHREVQRNLRKAGLR